MKEITVRVTKQLEKDVADLDRCVAQCDDARQKKTLERVSKNLKKAMGFSSSRYGQAGGMAPIDPAVYNTGDLLSNGGSNPIDAGASGAGLLNIHAPFYENGMMGAGQLFSAGTQPFYLPSSSTLSGGGKQKKRTNTQKTKKSG